jgi:hypothetical protein
VATYGTGASGSVGVRVPLSISYAPISAGASTYAHKIEFTYDLRSRQGPDGGRYVTSVSLTGYAAGLRMKNTSVLKRISISTSGTLTRRYSLEYSAGLAMRRPRLQRITECAGGAGTDCLRTTLVNYQEGATGFLPTPVSVATGNLTYIASADLRLRGKTEPESVQLRVQQPAELHGSERVHHSWRKS